MLWIKLLGGAVLVLAGGLASALAVYREKKRLSSMDAWIDLIVFIRGQIDCYLRPLDEILAYADPALLANCAARPQDKTLSHILQRALSLHDEESRRLLSGFVREMGDGYREEQVKRCDYYLTALQARREKLYEEIPQRIKLACTLCLCASVGAVILLW